METNGGGQSRPSGHHGVCIGFRHGSQHPGLRHAPLGVAPCCLVRACAPAAGTAAVTTTPAAPVVARIVAASHDLPAPHSEEPPRPALRRPRRTLPCPLAGPQQRPQQGGCGPRSATGGCSRSYSHMAAAPATGCRPGPSQVHLGPTVRCSRRIGFAPPRPFSVPSPAHVTLASKGR